MRALDPHRSRISEHRLLTGHRIGIHNDCPHDGTETHRLIVHFSDSRVRNSDGQLVLCNIVEPDHDLVIIEPVHNSVAVMEFSAHSWHSVEEVAEGIRYSLLYSF
jgi:Rps23 Pro-64 3,4-dihydroxylase Tpa1-like proline 4-hydroxylase